MGVRYKLLDNAVAIGAGQSANMAGDDAAVHVLLTGAGSLHTTLDIEVSNDNVNWSPYRTIVLTPDSGATQAAESMNVQGGWGYLRPNIKAISGAGAAVSVILGL